VIRIEATIRIVQIGDGPGGSYMLGQNQAEIPAFGSAQTAGEIGSAQYAEMRVAELVPGGDVPTAGNFTTVFTTLATDLGTMISATPNPFNGATQTLLSIVQGWSTGTP